MNPGDKGIQFVHQLYRANCLKMMIRRQRGQAHIDDGAADGEVVEGLVAGVVQSEHAVQDIVEEAADAGCGESEGCGFEVELLSDGAAFPVEFFVVVGAVGFELGLELA